MSKREALLDTFMNGVEKRNAGEREFLQAVEDVATDVLTVEKNSADDASVRVSGRLTLSDRMIFFRFAGEDDAGNVQLRTDVASVVAVAAPGGAVPQSRDLKKTPRKRFSRAFDGLSQMSIIRTAHMGRIKPKGP